MFSSATVEYPNSLGWEGVSSQIMLEIFVLVDPTGKKYEQITT